MSTETLTTYARVGYDGNPNPHLYSSPAFYAHALGQYLHDTGRSPPRDVRMSRGYSIRCNDDMLFKITHASDNRVSFERMQ